MRAGEQNTKEGGRSAGMGRKLGMDSQITGTENEELGPKAGREGSFVYYSADTLTKKFIHSLLNRYSHR